MRALLFSSLLLMNSSALSAENSVGVTVSNGIMQRYRPTLDVMARNGWDHANSTVLHGMEKVYKRSRDPAALAYIKDFADQFVQSDGSIKGMVHSLDGMHPGVLCLFLYEETKDKKYLAAARAMRDAFIGTAQKPSSFKRTPQGGYWHKSEDHYRDVMTVDGVYMVYPFLVRYALLAKEDALLDVAIGQILMVSEHTFQPRTNLAFHAWDYGKTHAWAHPITGNSSQFWSRSMGWYAMALVDVLEVLPKQHAQYGRLLYLFQNLAEGLQATQNPRDGMWYHVLDAVGQPGNYPETAGSGMVVYALQKGVNLKLLDGAYQVVAKQGWQGLQRQVTIHSDGGPQINSVAPGMGVQNDYAAYVAVRPVSVPPAQGKHHSHGYVALLMAASVME